MLHNAAGQHAKRRLSEAVDVVDVAGSIAAMAELSHVDKNGAISMVDVSAKPATARSATASGLLRCSPSTRDALLGGTIKKGEAIVTAKVAGVLAAKKTGELIPLCHPIALTDVQVEIVGVDDGLAITATARCVGPTGVEMEAMTAVSIAGLTLYDMGKAVERGMRLEAVRLITKTGGASGTWRADDDTTNG